MQITYELSEKDFVQAYRAHRNRTAFSKWTRRIFVGFLITTIAVGFVTFLLSPNVEARKNLIPLCLAGIVWVCIFWALPRWTMRRQFRKQPGAHGSRTLLLDENGMHWRWNGGSGDIEWKNYIRWTEDRNQILFYSSPACFNILPKHALTPEQLIEIRQVMTANIRPGGLAHAAATQ